MRFWTYRHRFVLDGIPMLVEVRSHSDRLDSVLLMDGKPVSRDTTPAYGPGATRNHRLEVPLPDGRALSVEAGYISAIRTGIAARVDGALLFESHPGRTIAYPEAYRAQVEAMGGATLREAVTSGMKDGQPGSGTLRRNGPSLLVDIGLGILFFVVAKLTDLTTAAIVGAAAGLALVVAQRFTKVDLLGGLAMFGIVMMLLSTGYALAFQSEAAIQLRPTVMGLVVGSLFLADSLAGGRYLAQRLIRYLPQTGIDPVRLARGAGLAALMGAGVNYAVTSFASQDVWLFYTTFGDFVLAMALMMGAIRYASRGGPRQSA